MNADADASADEVLRATGRREHPHCFACSETAAGGLGLRFLACTDGSVAAAWECPAGGEGYPGIVHGGLVATLLDAAMVHVLFARGIAARTGELRVRYRHPALIGSELVVRAWLTTAAEPLYRLRAEVRQGSSLCAEATAKFMRMRCVDAAPPTGCGDGTGHRMTV